MTGRQRISWALLLAAVPLSPALAGGYGDSYQAALAKPVREVETGIRATLRYFANVMTGGQEEIVNADGTTDMLYWDGLTGVFEAEVTEGPALTQAMAEHFLRDAAAVVCPSADPAAMAGLVVHMNDRFISAQGQCPAIDAKVGQ